MQNISQAQSDILTRSVAEVIFGEHLLARLQSGRKLRIKFGIDPTSPKVHIGRAVSLLKLRKLQEMGHTIVLLVGDFTGVIGDTSDKESERPMLTESQIEQNMKSYFEQIGKLIDLNASEKHYNSTWLGKLGYKEIGRQADAFSVMEFIQRENIKKRLDAGKRVSLREVLYPLMQGYDSVHLKADLEIGGIDQRFNLLAGRTLQEAYGQKPQDIMMVNLILGTDGRKMSSSWGNTINVLDEPNDMFGKLMSIPDKLIVTYLEHCTEVPMDEVRRIEQAITSDDMNPRDAKLILAEKVTSFYHSVQDAQQAREHFIETFSKKNIPTNLIETSPRPGETVGDLMVRLGFATSKTDARRKIDQGGVTVDGDRVSGVQSAPVAGVLKVGKRNFARIFLS